ncbi:MAG: cell division protein FtsL [Bacteroidota bacterium]|nr:cell division protein FtsL [Bacteroidota bacterium]MDP4233977.1 cell division protein FtsL [Bacteroidota bacterium]MDP4242772.1 cell division protein FtsL [Bacteroidota bacterium]MDP4288486.1 cell division protein FtsL [Bacteroidota bacterium]
MATIAISAGTIRSRTGVSPAGSGLIGVTGSDHTPHSQPRIAPEIAGPMERPKPIRQEPSEFERVVKKMPTLYVIVFFGVMVGCAVLIIWNTLQVNRLTAERTKLDQQIAQTEQRILRMRASEMQLSAPSRIEDISKAKLGMIEATGDDIVIVK